MSLAAEARAMGIRVPPHSVDAEQAVLGGLMLVPEKIESLADRLAVQDFYRKDHQLIYRAMLELSARGQPCDAVTMADWFDANDLGKMLDGNGGYLIHLANSTPSAANILAYAEIIRGKSVRRQVIDRMLVQRSAAIAVYYSTTQRDFERLMPIWQQAVERLVIESG